MIKVICFQCGNGKVLAWVGSKEETGVSHGVCNVHASSLSQTPQITELPNRERMEAIEREVERRLRET